MSDALFRIFTRFEERADGYWAVAVAIPEGRPLRCAPALRQARCRSRSDAPAVAAKVAGLLLDELARRDLKCVVN
jgi:hypothetical protein